MPAVVRVNVGSGYDVEVGPGLLRRCGERIARALGPCRAFVATDANVGPLYLRACLDSLADAGFTHASLTLPAGEAVKNLSSFGELLEAMAREGMSRTDVVVALGGGVIGDLAGFAAGCYMRGVPLVQVPTTLLAAVDSSVGGKTAVDLSAGKNLVGVFHQPSLVLCDTDCLTSLPDREYRCGAAEAIKVGILGDEPLFRLFEDGAAPRDRLPDVILHCVRYKAAVVERDERERGERRLLNLGHTVGHAIERCSDFSIPHGLAVAAGLAIIARASARRGWCAQDAARRIERTLIRNRLPATADFPAEALARAALSDKKRSGSDITLITPREVGACELRRVGVDELPGVIADGLAESGEVA